VVATRCDVANSFLTRGLGLIGRSRLAEGEGLLITRTGSITMLFMRFAIDALFVDRSMRVLRVAGNVRPWVPMVAAPRGTDSVLELPAGTAARTGTQAGDELITSESAAK
jgi:uncharacterized membrane protein (UPF0127 family)